MQELINIDPVRKIIPSCLYFKRLRIEKYEPLKIGIERAFYESLVKGKISLYRRAGTYFIQKDENPPVELREGKKCAG